MQVLRNIIRLCVVAGGLILAADGALAAGKVTAVVEQGATADGTIQLLDRLKEGTEFTLSAGESVTLAYTHSCIRETITGGKITVGAEQSDVTGGEVKREKIATCPEPRLALTSAESQESAIIAFRGGTRHLFSKTPMLVSRPDNLKLVLYEGETVIGEVKGESGIFDVAGKKLELAPGKVYRIESDRNTVLLEIDADAKAGGDFLTRYVYID